MYAKDYEVVRAVTIKARIAVITQIHATLYMISFFIIALYIFPLGKACNIEDVYKRQIYILYSQLY